MAVYGRNKESTLSQKIVMGSVETLNLPRNSVHDAYILRFDFNIANQGTTPYTVKIRDVLESIEEIRLVTDSIRVHYALNGYDLALLNAKIQPVQTHDILTREDVTIAAGANEHYLFNLYLDEGDIVAVAHNNVELSVHWNAEKLGTNINITSATCEVTLMETIYSAAQLQALYGESWENIVEPKVYALTTKAAGNTEFTGVLDLPTGTLLRGAIIEFTPDDAATTGPTYPKQVGILRTVPDRVELGKVDWMSHRMKDEIIYKTIFPRGIFIYDYGKQWQSNGIGKDGWTYAKGDVQLAYLAKDAIGQSIRYISLESLVNTAIYSQNFAFTTY